MRILIYCEDKVLQEQLRIYISEFFSNAHTICPEVVCFSDGQSLLNDSGEKDIVFLDVEMPGANGIYLGNELKKKNSKTIIFIVSSYSEYLDEAMKFHVFRYLSKPVDRQRFFRNMKDAVNLYYTATIKLAVETKKGVYTLPASDIIAIEAQSRKVLVYTEAKTYESVRPMKYWLDTLPENSFFQTHRSFIINMQHVVDFDHALVHMTGRHDAYLTKRKYNSFKDAYLLYLEGTR